MHEGQGATRAELLGGAALATAGTVAGGVLLAAWPDAARPGTSPKRDAEILNFALLLEYVQSSFYAEALSRNVLRGELRDFAQVVGAHEQTHVAALRRALGGDARKRPKLDFGDDTASEEAFTASALKLEDLGVAAYNSQAPNLSRRALEEAARIVSVEGRHASWIRGIAGENPAPEASEPTITPERVIETLRGSGYVR